MRNTDVLLQILRRYLDRRGPPGSRHTLGHLSHDLREFALQIAHTRLACVTLHNLPDGRLADPNVLRSQPVARQHLGEKVFLRNPDFFRFQVPREPDDFHAILQRRRDGVRHVRRRDEEDLAQVELDLEVVIAERVVLFRIEHLEQGRRGVAAEVARHFVDLVEKNDGVPCLCLDERLDDTSRHRPDVRASVPADLGLVADPTQ